MKLETLFNALDLAHLKIISDIFSKRPGHKCARQYHAFRTRILKMDAEKDKRIDILRAEHDYLLDGSRELKAELDEKDQMIRDMAWLAYMDQVVDTQSEIDLIGPDNEYADKEDWIESYIEGLKRDATQDRIQACH